MQDSWAYKSPLTIVEIDQEFTPAGRTLPKTRFFWSFWAAFPPPDTDCHEILHSQATHVTLGCAKFHVNRCNESPPRG